MQKGAIPYSNLALSYSTETNCHYFSLRVTFLIHLHHFNYHVQVAPEPILLNGSNGANKTFSSQRYHSQRGLFMKGWIRLESDAAI